MPSFDIVSDINKVELKNALDQSNKEVANRFDFKGTDARIEQKELELTFFADSVFQLQQVMDVFRIKCGKRGLDTRSLDPQEPEKIGGEKMKQLVKVKEGIEQELGKKIVKAIKDAKLNVSQ